MTVDVIDRQTYCALTESVQIIDDSDVEPTMGTHKIWENTNPTMVLLSCVPFWQTTLSYGTNHTLILSPAIVYLKVIQMRIV